MEDKKKAAVEELETPKTNINNNNNLASIASQQLSPPGHHSISNTNKNKRKLSNVDSSYFKIRALLRQLRPQFIQVLQTPDFRNCKAAHELQLQMKHLMNLYKQMIDPPEKSIPDVSGRQPWYKNQGGKLPNLLHPSHHTKEKKPTTYFDSHMKLDGSHIRKSYMVGGSAVGWNFITFKGGNPVYCGVTKESYRNTRRSKMSATGVSSHIG